MCGLLLWLLSWVGWEKCLGEGKEGPNTAIQLLLTAFCCSRMSVSPVLWPTLHSLLHSTYTYFLDAHDDKSAMATSFTQKRVFNHARPARRRRGEGQIKAIEIIRDMRRGKMCILRSSVAG